MTPETTAEDSDDPEWLKQIGLSLLVGVGPYFVHTNHQGHIAGPDAHAAPSGGRERRTRVKPIAPSEMPRVRPAYPDLPQAPENPALPGVADSAPAPLHVRPPELSAQISVSINQQTTAPASAVPARIYSYGSMSFAWRPDTAVTFSSLPRVWACITLHESSDMVIRNNPVSSAKGAFQIKSFMWAKYAPAGYPSNPNEATLSQQYRVALRIFRADGFAEWETAPLCGI